PQRGGLAVLGDSTDPLTGPGAANEQVEHYEHPDRHQDYEDRDVVNGNPDDAEDLAPVHRLGVVDRSRPADVRPTEGQPEVLLPVEEQEEVGQEQGDADGGGQVVQASGSATSQRAVVQPLHGN